MTGCQRNWFKENYIIFKNYFLYRDVPGPKRLCGLNVWSPPMHYENSTTKWLFYTFFELIQLYTCIFSLCNRTEAVNTIQGITCASQWLFPAFYFFIFKIFHEFFNFFLIIHFNLYPAANNTSILNGEKKCWSFSLRKTTTIYWLDIDSCTTALVKPKVQKNNSLTCQTSLNFFS